MKTKFFLLVALLAVVLGGCKSNEPDFCNNEKILGIWYVDSITPLGNPVNQSITFENKNIIYYIGPEGDETWGGETYLFSYKIENEQLFISAKNPLSFEFGTNFVMNKENHLFIERFSTDGTNFKSLNLKKKDN